MSDYLIATASTADLTIEYCREHAVPFISYTYTIDDVEYVDDLTDEGRRALFAAMRAGKQPHTSAISPYAYHEFFKGLLETGMDVLYVDMSRAVSSSIASAELAAQQVREEFPHQRFYFLDSYCITGGLALLVKQLVLRHEAGMSFDEVIAWGEAHKMEFIHRFMVEDLEWLRRGGRLSNVSAVVGSILSIKPLIYLDNEGRLVSFKTVRGRKHSFKALVESMADDLADYTALEEMVVIEADDREDVEKLAELARETYPQLKDAQITVMTLGPVIAAHVGPGFAAIAYHGKKRVK